MPKPDPEISDEVLEEGTYYLSKTGLTMDQIGAHFEITAERAASLAKAYEEKLKSGEVSPSEFDAVFWEDVRKEAEGDMKLTFLSDKGFHHSWKSELARLDGPALMSIYEMTKDFIGADPNQKFLDFPPPKGYDPLAMDRELRKAVEIIGKLLGEKWKEQRREAPGRKKRAKTLTRAVGRVKSKKVAAGHGRQ